MQGANLKLLCRQRFDVVIKRRDGYPSVYDVVFESVGPNPALLGHRREALGGLAEVQRFGLIER